MIFLPYISILQNNNETSQKLNDVQALQANFASVQDDINELRSDLTDDTRRIKVFFSGMIGNYINHRGNCMQGDYDLNARLIQTTDSEAQEVVQNVKDYNLWHLDVCNRLNVTKPPVFGTVLHFYRSNISDPAKSYKAYATMGPDRDRVYFSYPLTKDSISTLEYYNASFHIGSPFWLNMNAQNKIRSIFIDHDNSLKSIDTQISKLARSLSTADSDVIDRPSISRSLSELRNSLGELKYSFEYLNQSYLRLIPDITNALDLETKSDLALNDTIYGKLYAEIGNEIRFSTDPVFMNVTSILSGQIGEFENIVGSLNDRLERLTIREDETANRLKEIEFPFGNIPLGINESILFFPVGISAGFWISASLLGDSLLLRKRYHNIVKAIDKTTIEKNEGEIGRRINENLAILYPIWIDPITSTPVRIVKLIILSVPAIIFVASIYILMNSWQIIISQQDLEGLFIGNNRDNMLLYIASYVISSIFFISGYWRIYKELRNYFKLAT